MLEKACHRLWVAAREGVRRREGLSVSTSHKKKRTWLDFKAWLNPSAGQPYPPPSRGYGPSPTCQRGPTTQSQNFSLWRSALKFFGNLTHFFCPQKCPRRHLGSIGGGSFVFAAHCLGGGPHPISGRPRPFPKKSLVPTIFCFAPKPTPPAWDPPRWVWPRTPPLGGLS